MERLSQANRALTVEKQAVEQRLEQLLHHLTQAKRDAAAAAMAAEAAIAEAAAARAAAAAAATEAQRKREEAEALIRASQSIYVQNSKQADREAHAEAGKADAMPPHAAEAVGQQKAEPLMQELDDDTDSKPEAQPFMQELHQVEEIERVAEPSMQWMDESTQHEEEQAQRLMQGESEKQEIEHPSNGWMEMDKSDAVEHAAQLIVQRTDEMGDGGGLQLHPPLLEMGERCREGAATGVLATEAARADRKNVFKRWQEDDGTSLEDGHGSSRQPDAMRGDAPQPDGMEGVATSASPLSASALNVRAGSTAAPVAPPVTPYTPVTLPGEDVGVWGTVDWRQLAMEGMKQGWLIDPQQVSQAKPRCLPPLRAWPTMEQSTASMRSGVHPDREHIHMYLRTCTCVGEHVCVIYMHVLWNVKS